MNGPSEINDKCFPCSIETRQPFCSSCCPLHVSNNHTECQSTSLCAVKTQCPVTIQTTSETLF